ncbi:MAG: hypothetical protein IJL02_09020 [Methanobrevibacter sp.]|nr:hypothetical protein [Methanobrevibacter sp.]MBQ6099980.1 hypothetical protein [Methanobrevibacter sp.]MBQ6512706.1 hypothetical protein [Methanobrevibacter sp.]
MPAFDFAALSDKVELFIVKLDHEVYNAPPVESAELFIKFEFLRFNVPPKFTIAPPNLDEQLMKSLSTIFNVSGMFSDQESKSI